jgi:hypothetical protein
MELHFTPDQEAQLAQIGTQERTDAESNHGTVPVVLAFLLMLRQKRAIRIL